MDYFLHSLRLKASTLPSILTEDIIHLLCLIASSSLVTPVFDLMRAFPGGAWADSAVPVQPMRPSSVDLALHRNQLPFSLSSFPKVPSALPRWNAPKAQKWMTSANAKFDNHQNDLLLPFLAACPNLKPVGKCEEIVSFRGQLVKRYTFDVDNGDFDVTSLLTMSPNSFSLLGSFAWSFLQECRLISQVCKRR